MQTRLKLGAIFVGVFWTIGMILWSKDVTLPHVLILLPCGALMAAGWYWAMARCMRWQEQRRAS